MDPVPKDRHKPYSEKHKTGVSLVVRDKGKEKNTLQAGESMISLDDTLVTGKWKEHRTIPSPDPKNRRRNRSTEPETDKQGNMYYKVDPALITEFMEKSKATQMQIQ